MKRKRKVDAGIDYGTPLNKYLCTEYLYHNRCAHEGCDYVRHELPGVSGGECPKCGGDCWFMGMGCTPRRPEPWYVQYLDPTCPTCRKTLARLASFDQMELFAEAA